MKRIITFLIIIVNFCSIYCQIDSLTAKIVDSMVIEDQKWRNLATKVNKGEIDTISIQQVRKNINEVDSLNYIIINNLFNKFGYLGYNKIGETSSFNFWVLVQHADGHPKFQERVLDSMKIAAFNGNSSMKNYAYLVDRVKVNTGKLQIYGTQMKLDSTKTTHEPKPLEDPINLNKRRQEVGLSTIEEYIELMNNRYLKPTKK